MSRCVRREWLAGPGCMGNACPHTLRRSSFGFARNVYCFRSLPMKTIWYTAGKDQSTRDRQARAAQDMGSSKAMIGATALQGLGVTAGCVHWFCTRGSSSAGAHPLRRHQRRHQGDVLLDAVDGHQLGRRTERAVSLSTPQTLSWESEHITHANLAGDADMSSVPASNQQLSSVS